MASSQSPSTPTQQPSPPNKKNTKPLYNPTIFRYKCRGAFSITSDEPHSHGFCRGIQTQLQHVRDLQTSTEQASLDDFLQDFVPHNSGGDLANQNDILDVPAMVFDFNTKEVPPPPKNNTTAPEEWHDWSSYGSTEVRLLLLKDTTTNQEKVVAVAPQCRLGLAVRDVGHSQKGGDTVATVRLGPIEVLLRNQYEVEDDDMEHRNMDTRNNANVTTLNDDNDDGKTTKPKNHDDDDGPLPRNPNRSISPMMFYNAGQKVFAQSGKIVQSMQTNARILREATREDFPQRCVASSQRIVLQVGKTVTQTADLMQSLYELWNNGDDPPDK